MKNDYQDTFYTIDADYCTRKQLYVRIFRLLIDGSTKALRYRRSPRGKGFHIQVRTNYPVTVAAKRRFHRDDPKRLMHDLLNRPDHVHDILWDRKTINGKVRLAGKWSEWIN